MSSNLAKSPSGCRPIVLYLGHRMFHQCEPTQETSSIEYPLYSTMLTGGRPQVMLVAVSRSPQQSI